MDRMLYVAMSGARETLKAQAANNHNLANASTTGFHADMAAFQARKVEGSGFDSRVYATNSSIGFDHSGQWHFKEIPMAEFSGAGWEALVDSQVEDTSLGSAAYGRSAAARVVVRGRRD